MKHLSIIAASLALVAAGTSVFAYQGQSLTPQARITIVQARAIAIRAVPGTIVSEELEKEAGGSGLRYTFDIKAIHGLREVGVDAKTGEILENIAESPNG